jgi:hypothetical protein
LKWRKNIAEKHGVRFLKNADYFLPSPWDTLVITVMRLADKTRSDFGPIPVYTDTLGA